jgi:hypothetical protein
LSVAGSQKGFVPVQRVCESGVHSTQWPLPSSQTGVVAKPAHWASAVQAPQVWVDVLQIGVAPEHSLSAVH